MTSQADSILAHLRAGHTITPGQALDEFGCFRLAARISDIKAILGPDEEIVNLGLALPNGKHVARYSLVRREPAQVTLW